MDRYIHSVIASTAGWAGNIYDLLILTYVYKYFQEYLGLDTLESTLLFGIGLIMRVVGGYLFGKLADTSGRKRVFLIGVVGFSLSQGLMAVSPNSLWLLASRGLQGLFMGGAWASGTVLAFEEAPTELRGLINGVVQSGYGIGYALTGASYYFFSSESLMNGDGWRLFLLTGIMPILIFPYAKLKLRDVKVPQRVEARGSRKTKELMSVLVRVSLVISGMFFSYYSIFAVYPALIEVQGIPPETVGLLMAVANLSLAGSFIVFGRLSDTVSKRKLITYGVMGELFSLPLMLGYIGGGQGIGLMIYSISTGFWPLAPVLVMEAVPSSVRASLTGLSYNLGSVAGGIGSIIMGALVQAYGLGSAREWGLILGLGSLSMVLVTMVTWKRGRVAIEVIR